MTGEVVALIDENNEGPIYLTKEHIALPLDQINIPQVLPMYLSLRTWLNFKTVVIIGL